MVSFSLAGPPRAMCTRSRVTPRAGRQVVSHEAYDETYRQHSLRERYSENRAISD